MASAEELLREAQYAFQNISFGDSRDNRKNTARAKSLATRITRKFPTSTEANGARAILWSLRDVMYSGDFESRHNHSDATDDRHTHERATAMSSSTIESDVAANDQSELLDRSLLVRHIVGLPKSLLAVFVLIGIFLFSIFGVFLVIPVLMLIVLATPLQTLFPAKSRNDAGDTIRKMNAWLREQDTKRRRSG